MTWDRKFGNLCQAIWKTFQNSQHSKKPLNNGNHMLAHVGFVERTSIRLVSFNIWIQNQLFVSTRFSFYVYMYVCVYMCVYVRVYVCKKYVYICIFVLILTYVCMCMCMCLCIYTYIYIYYIYKLLFIAILFIFLYFC